MHLPVLHLALPRPLAPLPVLLSYLPEGLLPHERLPYRKTPLQHQNHQVLYVGSFVLTHSSYRFDILRYIVRKGME